MGAVAHDRKAALDIGVEERVVGGEHGQRVRDLPLAVKVPSAEVHVRIGVQPDLAAQQT